MTVPSRYNISRFSADLIDENILKNKLAIKDQKLLEDTETILLADTYQHFFDLFETGKIIIDVQLLFDIHTFFFKPLYAWAGKIRRVNVSKDSMMFCGIEFIESSLKQFNKLLTDNLPERKEGKKITSKKLALIHNELNAIHPFREGNGRASRLFLDLLAVNAGYQIIDYSHFTNEAFIQACVAGMSGKNDPMEEIIYQGLTKQ